MGNIRTDNGGHISMNDGGRGHGDGLTSDEQRAAPIQSHIGRTRPWLSPSLVSALTLPAVTTVLNT